MITMTTEIEVRGKTPAQIFAWNVNMDDTKYKQWHPAHVEWKTIKRTAGEVGSIAYFHEEFDGFRLAFTGELIDVKPNRLLRYQLKYLIVLPAYLSLSFDPTEAGTKVIHEVRVGIEGMPGKVLDWILRKVYLTPAYESALSKHAIEEFKNLEWLI